MRIYTTVLSIAILLLNLQLTNAEHRIGSVARLKGQETTVIHGFGLVTGLNGKGDKADFSQTGRVLNTMMMLGGHSGATAKDMAASKNIALVKVSVTIPAEGARSGDRLDCTVSAIGSATALEGGRLEITQLIGPIPYGDTERTPVYGFANGTIIIEKDASKTVGKITNGARLTDDFRTPYIDPKTGNLTIVLNQQFATMKMADDIAVKINSAEGADLAMAVDSKNVIVRVPKEKLANPVAWIAEMMNYSIFTTGDPFPTVRINESAGIVLIGESVEIDPISLTINGITIQAAGGAPIPPPERFVALDVQRQLDGTMPNPKLKALNDAMNAIKVPTKDIIAAIKELDKMGKIHGEVIYE